MKRANYRIIADEVDKPLILDDVGPWDRWMTITNAAEDVVEELVKAGKLPEGRKLFYYDSEDELTELVIENGRFSGFKFVDMTKGYPSEN